jgi:hypothetical protein
MASVIAAPMNNNNIMGVAWRASLAAIRHDGDIRNGLDVSDTRQAIERAAGQYGSRVIAMAFQSADYFSSVSDEIRLWYSRGVLFIGAAGSNLTCTNVNQIVFPAEMDEVFAVTGANADGTLSCGSFYSWHVEAAAVVNQPVTGAIRVGDFALGSISRSSNATGVVAGIAALVWSRYPQWTRDQVWNRLIWSTSSYGSAKTQETGYGVIDAFAAVGGMRDVMIWGEDMVAPYGTMYLTAHPEGDGPFAYQWSTGATTATITVQGGAEGTYTDVWVNVTDQVDGRSIRRDYRVYSGYRNNDTGGDCTAVDRWTPC